MCDTEKELVEKLKSTNTTEVYDALVKIRKNYVRDFHRMELLQKYSVIQLIIPFLEHPKFCNISLSIIADGCLELGFVNEVIKYNGINSLMRIMKSFVSDDIQNRACRALGNMAKFEVGFKAVHLMKPVSNIINFLSETSNVNCQQTAVRTLMILGKSSKTREIITRENGIVCIAKLLHSSNVQLLICSIKAIANLTQNCSLSCARQLLELEFFKVLVELYSHNEKSVRNHALISLKNLSSQEEVRSSLIKVGAVKLFTEVLSSCESHEMSKLAALALCSCLDHIHMWSNNGTDRAVGLKALLVVLQNQKYQDIHIQVITSLIPLAYEHKVSDILLSLDVLQILIKILEVFLEKHKCRATVNNLNSSLLSSCQYLFKTQMDTDTAIEELNSEFQLDISSNIHPKCNVKTDTEITCIKYKNMEKVQDISPRNVTKWDRSLYSYSSITSDYSGSCSPLQKPSTSPDFNYDQYYRSPSSGVWSPVSLEGENLPKYITCWSPVVSTHSNSPTPEKDTVSRLEDDDESDFHISPTKSIFSLNIDKTDDLGETSATFIDDNVPSTSQLNDQINQVPELESGNNDNETSLDSEFHSPRKKRKAESSENQSETLSGVKGSSGNNSNKTTSLDSECCCHRKKLKTDSSENQSETSDMGKDSSDNSKGICIDKQLAVSKQLIDGTEIHRIDHYVVLFIWYLSFHLKTDGNSQIADKFCFSVLIDYLCFVHKPSPKTVKILIHLIKNRHCFQKLILNGFVLELENKMKKINYSCAHHSEVRLAYIELINTGRQEAESDYGIGTLSHIFVTSKKQGKFYAICATSKLITEKSALYRLLFKANGLAILLNFLSDNNVTFQRSAVISLCEVYQSITKDQKNEKCCFLGTCNMKVSSKCSYKESFLNVTFSVRNGAKILANRDKICKNSEYFSALLSGHFLEKSTEMVSLPNMSAENLSAIFHFLHGCCSDICCPYIKRIPFSVLLELLSDCEMLLLLDIKAYVEDGLCHRLIPSTVSNIYKHSKIHNSPALTKRTLDFALRMNTSEKDTLWNCFNELINLDSNLNFISDVENLIKDLF